MIGTAALLLLRLSTSVRTWSPFLQGLAAAGVTYPVSTLVIAVTLRMI